MKPITLRWTRRNPRARSLVPRQSWQMTAWRFLVLALCDGRSCATAVAAYSAPARHACQHETWHTRRAGCAAFGAPLVSRTSAASTCERNEIRDPAQDARSSICAEAATSLVWLLGPRSRAQE